MQENIDRRPHLRRQAIGSALGSALVLLIFPGALALLARRFCPIGWVSGLLLVAAIICFALLLPLAMTLRERLHEIQGGEENEASHY